MEFWAVSSENKVLLANERLCGNVGDSRKRCWLLRAVKVITPAFLAFKFTYMAGAAGDVIPARTDFSVDSQGLKDWPGTL